MEMNAPFLMRTAQLIQTRLNLPLLIRTVRLEPQINDLQILQAAERTQQLHPLSSVWLDLAGMMQHLCPEPWPVICRQSDEPAATVPETPENETIRTNDVIETRTTGTADLQLHRISLTLTRCPDAVLLHFRAPHTIVDGYGMNAVVGTFLALLKGEVTIEEGEELAEFQTFVAQERQQQANPAPEEQAFWEDNFSRYEPLALPAIASHFNNEMKAGFSLSASQVKAFSNKCLRARASLSTGLLTAFALAFSKTVQAGQLAVRMTDNQRRQGRRHVIGGYFAEDYTLFFNHLPGSDVQKKESSAETLSFEVTPSFEETLLKTARMQRNSLKYIGSFRTFDLPDKNTTAIKYHYVRVWNPENLSDQSNLSARNHPPEQKNQAPAKKEHHYYQQTHMDKLLRVNAVPVPDGLIIQLLYNRNYFSESQIIFIQQITKAILDQYCLS